MATFGSWLREQTGREDQVGMLSEAILGTGEWPRQHSRIGIEKWLKGTPGMPGWWPEALAAAESEYKRRRGDLQPVPRMEEDTHMPPADAAGQAMPPLDADVSRMTELDWRRYVALQLALLQATTARCLMLLQPLADVLAVPEDPDWDQLLVMADFEGLEAEDAPDGEAQS